MPTQPCNPIEKPIAQTLFLGASVSSFTTNLGWGSQPSQLTVNLVEDELALSCDDSMASPRWSTNTECPECPRTDLNDGSMYQQFIGSPDVGTLNHFTDAVGIKHYIDKYTKQEATIQTPVENRILRGKVYYKYTNAGMQSLYWTNPDPGFFGNQTRINFDGTFNTAPETSHPGYKYDIIDTPVYFKMGNFEFGGFVQSWSRDMSSGGKQYTVIVNGPQSILNSSYVILDQYVGSIFSKNSASLFGGPKNYLYSLGIEDSSSLNNVDLSKGSIANVFNVYGFLESSGPYGFGGSRKNSSASLAGISINDVLRSLMILTSTTNDSSFKLGVDVGGQSDRAKKSVFSPFGRIISKSAQREDIKTPVSLYTQSTIDTFGMIPPANLLHLIAGPLASPRCNFVLDLHDVLYTDNTRSQLRMSDSIKINNTSMSIMELLNEVSEKIGCDFSYEFKIITHSAVAYNVIKVNVISRLKQPAPNIIENTIKGLECNNYAITSHSIGKEKNNTAARSLTIGAPQQRLLQVKSYRLAYSQSNFIFNPNTKNFVNYMDRATVSAFPAGAQSQGPGVYGHGKIRFPNYYSTRNINNHTINLNRFADTAKTANYLNILTDENLIAEANTNGFKTVDSIWSDSVETGSGLTCEYNNYLKSTKTPNKLAPTSRWFPLYLDNICPFFGFVHDSNISLNINDNKEVNSNFRSIRPVWFDSWTGQIVVVVRMSELPLLNCDLRSSYLEKGPAFSLPHISTSPTSFTGFFNNLGGQATYIPEEYFILTESEIRAAIAGFDNYLVYSLAKTYKPDLIELVRRSYFIKTREQLKLTGVTPAEAATIASQETDWYWKLLGSNIAGDDLYPTFMYPDKNDGSQYIQEKALQDLKIIHKFITSIAKYYGKKYMVMAPRLDSYRDEKITSTFKSRGGYGYIIDGDGSFNYNYTPTNDGAWEEYGNIIDDSFVVGSTQWYSLSDDNGKIKPLLGYNNNYSFDYIRHNKCLTANNALINKDLTLDKANPYFSYNNWLTLQEYKTSTCAGNYVFPSLDIASLSNETYVVIDQKAEISPVWVPAVFANTLAAITPPAPLPCYDAWNTQIKDSGNQRVLPKSKVYVTTSVDENVVYLDPVTLSGPRILIDSPGINLSLSSEENAKDPNRTVITNVAAEDLLLYLKTNTGGLDYNWISYMMNYISPIVMSDATNPYYLGLYTVSSNHTANNVELAPKAAHPFFAGIPIKSNQYCYGPWTNYPKLEGIGLFPPGFTITQTYNNGVLSCATGSPVAMTQVAIDRAINNLISDVNIEFNEEFAPWNYGGMGALDAVAYKTLESSNNYQSVIETAQLEMPGLPLFNIGGNFVINNIGLNSVPVVVPSAHLVRNVNVTSNAIFDWITNSPIAAGLFYGAADSSFITPAVTSIINANYTVLDIKSNVNFKTGPIISALQISIGPNGVSTTYSFRTYTRKMGLFNKEESDRIKKASKIELQRNKKFSQIDQEITNIKNNQREIFVQERLNKSQFGSSDLSSKLFGWSPGTVLIGQANPIINEPSRSPKYIEDFSKYSTPTVLTAGGTPNFAIPTGSVDSGTYRNALADTTSPLQLKQNGRISTTVQLFERKEVSNQLDKDYGMQSAMSLDGLLSPISFYPTFKNSTFPYSLHNTASCPFCFGTKRRKIQISKYKNSGPPILENLLDVICDKCTNVSQKLNAKLATDDDIPITLIGLNPIVVPYGEFKNGNSQNYVGKHPDGAHDDISSQSETMAPAVRSFIDRNRHCIEIVARGSVPQSKSKYALETSRNLDNFVNHPAAVPKTNLDYALYDEALFYNRSKINVAGNNANLKHENNQRFFGLRGPLTLHAWGYDDEGYPVPNAADEPLAYDKYGRPKRFNTKTTVVGNKKYKSLSPGDMFQIGSLYYTKSLNDQNLPAAWASLTKQAIDDTSVSVVKIEDDMKNAGSYTASGSIISKTQKFNGKWSEKIKLNEFYLNWAERPDLWKVGPIDLKWDPARHVWTGGGGAEEIDPPYILTNNSDIDTLKKFLDKKSKKKYIYRMVYITLEEDLIKQPDFDESYTIRGFFDDVEFSKEPLQQGYRRLVYVKDKTGYCAPRGTKLLCRYNRLTGFYEPVSKPSIIAKGKITGTTALIDMHYVQGRKAGVVPTMTVPYDNPLEFTTTSNQLGIFTFLNGKWTLTSTK